MGLSLDTNLRISETDVGQSVPGYLQLLEINKFILFDFHF
jgi:hypothetical protein